MHRVTAILACMGLLSATAAWARPPEPPRPAISGAGTPAMLGWKAVLVAGDGSIPVFDDAVADVAARLQERDGVAPGDIQRLSATPAIVARGRERPASLDNVLDAVGSMRPAAGQGCFVFATSHGAPGYGLVLNADGREALSPAALNRALARGCGDAPTVVVVSACFSGIFARPPITRANRIVLTAARPDRASFGCGAGRAYTVYDRCLLNAMDAGGAWRQVFRTVRGCVAAEEREGGFTPSEPQAWFGQAVADLTLPTAEAAGH